MATTIDAFRMASAYFPARVAKTHPASDEPEQQDLPFPEDSYQPDKPKDEPKKKDSPFAAKVWKNTNWVTSDRKTDYVVLEGLAPGAKELDGEWAKVDGANGQVKLNGKFDWDPFETNPVPPQPKPPDNSTYPSPYDDDADFPGRKRTPKEPKKPYGPQPVSTMTREEFNQVQLYSSLTTGNEIGDEKLRSRRKLGPKEKKRVTGLVKKLMQLGFDMSKIVKGSKNGKFIAHADAMEDMNAYFSPQDEQLYFGTSEGKWGLAEDDDVTHHEAGHFVLYQIIPALLGWQSREGIAARKGQEGGAIHEGFGDLIAALIADDPEVSEDFPPATGEDADKGKGLRTVDNEDIKLSTDRTEVHDRGEVYAAFFWSLKKKLQSDYRMTSGDAADFALMMVVNQAFFIRTGSPRPADFVKAVLAGTEALSKEGKFPPGVSLAALKNDIVKEAIHRDMIKKASEVEPKDIVVAGGRFDLDAVRKEIAAGDDRIRFMKDPISKAPDGNGPSQKAWGIGGSREFYQEWVQLDDGHAAKVMGGGFYVFRDRSGNAYGYSKVDVVSQVPKPAQKRNFAPGKTLADAIVIARAQAQQELNDATRELSDVKRRLPFKRGRAELKILKEAQKNYRIAKVAAEKATRLSEKDAQLVMIPGQQDVHYEFRMGLSLYYVNAQDGKTMTKDDVVWN